MYTSTEAMTTAQVIVQVFYAICIFKLQATQISTVTSQSLQALPCKYIYKPVTFPLNIVVCGSHGFSRGVHTMMYRYLDMTCFISYFLMI